jgi:hypothetical protein
VLARLNTREHDRLQAVYQAAFERYMAQPQNTLDLLTADSPDVAAVSVQRAAEVEAFELYRAAMRAYADFIWQEEVQAA